MNREELARKYSHVHHDVCTDCFAPDIDRAFKAGYDSRQSEITALEARVKGAEDLLIQIKFAIINEAPDTIWLENCCTVVDGIDCYLASRGNLSQIGKE